MSETATGNKKPRRPDTRQCRICLGGVEEVEELGRLIKPCHCRGSMRYVHVNCLNTWRTSSPNGTAFWSCPQCKFKYTIARTKILGLSTSKLVKIPTTIFVFLLIVFSAGNAVSIALPYLNNPSVPVPVVAHQAPTLDHGWGWSWSPLYFVPEFVKEALHTAAELSAPQGVEERYARYSSTRKPPLQRPRGFPVSWNERILARPLFTRENKKMPASTNQNPPAYPTDGPSSTYLERLVRKFALGLSLVGIVSFLNLLASMSLFAPLQIVRARLVRQNNRNETFANIATITVMIFIAVGTARAIYGVYIFTGKVTEWILKRAESVILEVQDDDEEEEEARASDEEESRKEAKEPERAKKNPGASSEFRRRVRNPGDDFGDELPDTPGAWHEEWNWT